MECVGAFAHVGMFKGVIAAEKSHFGECYLGENMHLFDTLSSNVLMVYIYYFTSIDNNEIDLIIDFVLNKISKPISCRNSSV